MACISRLCLYIITRLLKYWIKHQKIASYTSLLVQKKIVYLFTKVKGIHDEISDGMFCLIIDEARNESKKEE